MKRFQAPWSTPLKVITLSFSALCLTVAGVLLFSGEPVLPWIAIFPIGLLFGTALFAVRDYTVTSGAIIVRRLLWETELATADLIGLEFDPDAMKASLRVGGNGGLFSFSGFFTNQKLGSYRAWLTDPKLSVILTFEDRKVVVSPRDPTGFVRDVLEIMNPDLETSAEPLRSRLRSVED